MLRVHEFKIPGPAVNDITHIVQHPRAGPMSRARLAAGRTDSARIVATAPNDLCLGQSFGTGDAFRGVWNVYSGTRHGEALLVREHSTLNLPHLPAVGMGDSPAMMLKTP